MAETVLNDNADGILWARGNETVQDAKNADAAKVRVGGPQGGAFSADLTAGGPDERRTEVVVLAGGRSYLGGGELGISVWDGTEPITDLSQRKVIEIRHNEIEFKVPVKGLGGAVVSPSGRYHAIMQDDGNFVVYDTDPDSDPGTGWWAAVWSWLTGRL